MKHTLKAVIAMAFVAGAAQAQVAPDSESLQYELSGTIASNCVLVPNGTSVVNVDMSNFGNQGLAAVAYSCNSPYTLRIASANGGLQHQESGGAITIAYDVETFGFLNDDFGNGPQSFNSAAIAATPAVVAQDLSWTNILLNGGVQTGNLDLVAPSLANSSVAGTYQDTLTLTLTADI
ncbi:MAG: hypothetical protein GC205_09990 [Bacteroidetes bacterium]|nr:hypothetical protein [Bacteroidota bacterium]